jgi:hypothetical protein
MTEDPRCCGSGTCIIDAAGRCWCGQQWDGTKMCFPPMAANTDKDEPNLTDSARLTIESDRNPD